MSGKIRSGAKLKEYRQSYNYRAEYFKRNPGIFNNIWFCSQCYKPLIGRKNVIIDHIVPLSKGGRNHVSNCTAICQKCNLSKSDKIDGRIIKGGVFKLVESSVSRGSRGVGAAAGLTLGLTASIAGGGLRLAKTATVGAFKGVGKTLGLVTYPMRKGSIVSRLFFVALYAVAILYLLKRYTNILDAWL